MCQSSEVQNGKSIQIFKKGNLKKSQPVFSTRINHEGEVAQN